MRSEGLTAKQIQYLKPDTDVRRERLRRAAPSLRLDLPDAIAGVPKNAAEKIVVMGIEAVDMGVD